MLLFSLLMQSNCYLIETEVFCVWTVNCECCLGHNNMSYDHHRSSGPPPSVHKASAAIDVIGSSVRDTRRQQLEFRESEPKLPDLYAIIRWILISLILLNYKCCTICFCHAACECNWLKPCYVAWQQNQPSHKPNPSMHYLPIQLNWCMVVMGLYSCWLAQQLHRFCLSSVDFRVVMCFPCLTKYHATLCSVICK